MHVDQYPVAARAGGSDVAVISKRVVDAWDREGNGEDIAVREEMREMGWDGIHSGGRAVARDLWQPAWLAATCKMANITCICE